MQNCLKKSTIYNLCIFCFISLFILNNFSRLLATDDTLVNDWKTQKRELDYPVGQTKVFSQEKANIRSMLHELAVENNWGFPRYYLSKDLNKAIKYSGYMIWGDYKSPEYHDKNRDRLKDQIAKEVLQRLQSSQREVLLNQITKKPFSSPKKQRYNKYNQESRRRRYDTHVTNYLMDDMYYTSLKDVGCFPKITVSAPIQ